MVGVVAMIWADDLVFYSWQGQKTFFYPKTNQASFAPHLFEGYFLTLGIEQPGLEADHLPP
jgi:hypothetical protein